MSSSAETVESVTYETSTGVTTGTTQTNDCSTDCGYDASEIALWIVTIIFILFLTGAMWCGFSRWSKKGGKGRKDSDTDDSCDRDRNGCNNMVNGLAGFLIWLILIIIIIAVVWKWKWCGLIAIVVLFIIFGVIFCWSCSSGKNKDTC